MIRLTSILSEIESKKLRIFDLDDTLIKSNSKVRVVHVDGTYTVLEPGSYATYDQKPGDKFDFSEFSKIIDPKEIKAMTNVLRNFYNASGKRRITILSARSAKPETIKNFMKTIGIDNIEVVSLYDSNPQKKADWIEDKILQGYNDIFFADDSSKNIDAVSALKSKYPNVKWEIRLVNYKP